MNSKSNVVAALLEFDKEVELQIKIITNSVHTTWFKAHRSAWKHTSSYFYDYLLVSKETTRLSGLKISCTFIISRTRGFLFDFGSAFGKYNQFLCSSYILADFDTLSKNFSFAYFSYTLILSYPIISRFKKFEK